MAGTVGGFSSIGTLVGAFQVNELGYQAARLDLGGKIQLLISAVNLLNTSISTINAALVSAANSGVTFSAFSTVPASTAATIVNFLNT
jgi:hypothetical protein